MSPITKEGTGHFTRARSSDLRCSGTICGFRNPEDIEFVETAGLLLVSNMRFDGPVEDGGFLAALEVSSGTVTRLWPSPSGQLAAPEPTLGDPSCTTPPAADAFYPHGLTAVQTEGRVLVYVVGHAGDLGGRNGIEIFR